MAVFAVTAVSVIVLVLQSWLPWRRVHGLLHLGLAAYVLLTLPSAAMVMHPENPARSSSSMGIQFAFLGAALLSFLIGVWFVVCFGAEKTAEVRKLCKFAIGLQICTELVNRRPNVQLRLLTIGC